MIRNNFYHSHWFLQLYKIFSPPAGLEPATFRLTAERANQLRHGGSMIKKIVVRMCMLFLNKRIYEKQSLLEHLVTQTGYEMQNKSTVIFFIYLPA